VEAELFHAETLMRRQMDR